VALVTEVFFDDREGTALREVLVEAKRRGAEVAVLPELPLNGWAPATKESSDEDAEASDGSRQRVMSEAAAAAGVALVGGAIVRDPDSGRRFNTAFLYTADGKEAARYRKVHLPEEEGYWETSHYEPGDDPPEVYEALNLPIGLQICSDVNRPQGFQLLAAGGAEVVFAPRATPPETYERWRLILRANAVMSGTYVISTNRPRPERGASIGGPSVAIDPFGDVLLETTDRIAIVELDHARVEAARKEYPGYLERFPVLYSEGWARLADH
jgi:predicted amidohydrolase